MGIREKLNNNPKLAAVATAAFIGVSCICFALEGNSSRTSATRAFYSDDDGATWFADDTDKVTPFDHDGKQAVSANVAQLNGRRFVAYLQRENPEYRQYFLDLLAARTNKTPPPKLPGKVRGGTTQVKRPGDKNWIPTDNYKASGAITCLRSSDGQAEEIVQP